MGGGAEGVEGVAARGVAKDEEGWVEGEEGKGEGETGGRMGLSEEVVAGAEAGGSSRVVLCLATSSAGPSIGSSCKTLKRFPVGTHCCCGA